MPARISSGGLYHRVAFDMRERVSNGAGGTIGKWLQQFECRAAFTHLRGGEAVMADRLGGKHVQVITVRASALAKTITTDWRVRDVRSGTFVGEKWTGTSFNIRDITPNNDRMFLDILVESGVANG